MVEAGKAYVGANKLFVSGIRDLSQHCREDQMISVRLRPHPGLSRVWRGGPVGRGRSPAAAAAATLI